MTHARAQLGTWQLMRAVFGAAVLGITASASGQPTLAQPPWPRIQQGFEDVEPLARSTAIQPLNLRTPTNFEDVYDLGDGRLARIDGNVIAIFPRSTYTVGATGAYPTIPPGTIFYIGMPPGVGAGPDDAFGRRQGLSIARNAGRGPDLRATALRSAAAAPASTQRGPAGPGTIDLIPRLDDEPPSIFGSEAERRRVVGGLLLRARTAVR